MQNFLGALCNCLAIKYSKYLAVDIYHKIRINISSSPYLFHDYIYTDKIIKRFGKNPFL